MRGKSSPKQGSKSVNKLDKQKEEPHLSGAYIRSLVKQLTSARTKDPLDSQDQENSDGEGLSSNQTLKKNSDEMSTEKEDHSLPPPEQPPQHKKQVRRRLHTSRPYQERLLNMAEARKEIVTALKSHRAAMKQQQQQQQQQEPEGHVLQESHQIQMQILEQEGGKSSKSRRNNQRIYASSSTNNNSSYPAFVCPPNYPYHWPLMPPVAPPIPILQFPESLNLSLPYQPLGLNLNFQDFNLDSCFFNNSTPSQSSSSSPPLSFSINDLGNSQSSQEVIPPPPPPPMVLSGNIDDDSEDMGLHHAVDDKEMEEIRSVGEQHQIEWNDTMNVVTSARWFKFLKSMEFEHEENGCEQQLIPFDEIMEFPSWLQNSNEGPLEDCLCLADYCSDDYMQDDALPCMEIEEIEGMDGEWLSS